MAQATDLRIGTAFEYNTSEGWELNIIDAEDILMCVVENEYFNEVYRPIPITEKILLKCGFIHHHDTPHPNKVFRKEWEEGYFDLEKIISYYFGGNFINVEVKYLHQLQNLYFALTNQELIINL